MLGGQSSAIPSDDVFICSENGFTCKKKRRPAGTPDPGAEVILLSPETLMETDSYTCEICNQGFPRGQNLQMHRRRHNVPWALLKRDVVAIDAAKRVYVCPEPTCLHHEPCHALGDLVGIKKHFKRKHTNQRQWVCEKCSKGYAIQSDLKAHLKTCGTTGHSCDCGRVFSRVETFIEHQDTCKAPKPAYLLQSPTLSINTNSSKAPLPNSTLMLKQKTMMHHNFELQKLTSSSKPLPTVTSVPLCTQLKLSVGSASHVEKNESNTSRMNNDASKAHLMERIGINTEGPLAVLGRLKDEAREQLQISAEEKAFVEKRRQQANWQIVMAKQEMINANRIREQALAELSKARVLKERAMKQINPNTLQITCNACKKQYLQLITKEGAVASTPHLRVMCPLLAIRDRIGEGEDESLMLALCFKD